jgi:hypothetical protein
MLKSFKQVKNKRNNKMKMQKNFITISVMLIAVFWGCSNDNPSEPPQNTGTQTSLSKLSDIQEKVFNVSCAFSGCHGATGTKANLLLTNGNSFSNLVNAQSVLYPQFKRVEPNNSANSLLIKILRGQVSPQMPFNGTPLSASVIDSIAKWIDNGALNN